MNITKTFQLTTVSAVLASTLLLAGCGHQDPLSGMDAGTLKQVTDKAFFGAVKANPKKFGADAFMGSFYVTCLKSPERFTRPAVPEVGQPAVNGKKFCQSLYVAMAKAVKSDNISAAAGASAADFANQSIAKTLTDFDQAQVQKQEHHQASQFERMPTN